MKRLCNVIYSIEICYTTFYMIFSNHILTIYILGITLTGYSDIDFSILKFEERSVGNRRDLIIKNIKTEDAGWYTAECAGVQFKTKFNLVGLKKWTTSFIHSNLAAERKFQAPLRNQMAYIGSIALFECCTRNTEMPVSWFVNGKLICGQTFSILKYEQMTRNNYHRLIIKNISTNFL